MQHATKHSLLYETNMSDQNIFACLSCLHENSNHNACLSSLELCVGCPWVYREKRGGWILFTAAIPPTKWFSNVLLLEIQPLSLPWQPFCPIAYNIPSLCTFPIPLVWFSPSLFLACSHIQARDLLCYWRKEGRVRVTYCKLEGRQRGKKDPHWATQWAIAPSQLWRWGCPSETEWGSTSPLYTRS